MCVSIEGSGESVICAGSSRSSLLDTAISTNISHADSYVKAHTCKICTRGVIVNGIMANNNPKKYIISRNILSRILKCALCIELVHGSSVFSWGTPYQKINGSECCQNCTYNLNYSPCINRYFRFWYVNSLRRTQA